MSLISTYRMSAFASMTYVNPPHSHQHRTAPYGPPEYSKEFGAMVNAINNNPKITTRGNLIAPSLSGTQESKGWTLDAVWNTNFIQDYGPAVGALAVER